MPLYCHFEFWCDLVKKSSVSKITFWTWQAVILSIENCHNYQTAFLIRLTTIWSSDVFVFRESTSWYKIESAAGWSKQDLILILTNINPHLNLLPLFYIGCHHMTLLQKILMSFQRCMSLRLPSMSPSLVRFVQLQTGPMIFDQRTMCAHVTYFPVQQRSDQVHGSFCKSCSLLQTDFWCYH